MLNQKQSINVIHDHLIKLFTYCLLSSFALIVSGCGGGGSTSSTGTASITSAASLVLTPNTGGVCETLLNGVVYTHTPPPLSCNHGTDPYTAYLDGSKSSASDGETLSYAWSFVSKPMGSNATLSGENTAQPTFVPDTAGAYEVQLVVSANGVTSPRAVALVVALDDATLNPNLTANPSAATYHFHGGLSNNCAGCHSAANPALQTKSSTHMATSNMCQACHSPIGFTVASFVDHAEVFGKCSDCHNGVIATGKSATHLVTTQECNDCHTTTSFITLNADGTFDHSNITEPCSACHNGITAIGTASAPNPPGHPNISVECNNCHTTAAFKPPFPNHNDPNVVKPGTCGQAGCHDGVSPPANGINSAPNPHPSTGDITIACDLCHNTTSFNLGGVFDHDVLARHPIPCMACHDGVNAMGKIAGHVPTTADCSNCHDTTSFVGGFVDHSSSTVTGQSCTDCHDGTKFWNPVDASGNPLLDANGNPITQAIPGPPTYPTFPQFLADFHTANASQSCGACHSPGGSFTLATVDHSSFGTVGAITLPSGTTCADCHDGSFATGKSSGHLVTTEDCGVCHQPQGQGNPPAINWLGAGFNHSSLSIAGNVSTPTCGSCHDGTNATGRSLTHVPLPVTGQDCLVCHGSTTFTSFQLTTFDHAAAGITNNCVSCHDGKTHDTTLVINKPVGHIPTADDCSKCHADTANGPGINGSITSGFARADPFINAVHPAYTNGCRNCHNDTYDNAIYLAKSHPIDSVHTTVDANNWECNACHTTTGNFKETNPVNHQDPTIEAQTCVSCHAAGRTVEPIGKGPTHPATSDSCQDCHQAGGSFTAGFDHTTLNSGGSNYGLACMTCHDGLTATGKTQNHVPTTRDCIACHAGYPPTVTSFVGGTFDHTGPEMSGKQCMDCHDGVIATGKTATHIPTNQDCGACHSITTFANATSFDHTGVTSGCQASGCHTSGNPSVTDVTDDPNRTHIPIVNSGTEVDCYNCHKSPGGTFANASMDHTVVAFEGCESCHDGNHDGANAAHIATAKSSTHFVTSITPCASCHTSTSAWTTVAYKHSSGGGYPGDHNASKVTSCSQCHNNSPANADISTFPDPTYGSTCAACHASQGKQGHGNPLPSNRYDCGRSGCHNVSSRSFNN